MMRSVVIALGIAAAVALPAGAQRVAAEIALVEAAAPEGAVVLGEVRAEFHQRSLFARTPARDLVDRELRAQAAKLGADAVVDIKYENSSPLLSKKGFTAVGNAVRLAPPPVQLSAAAPPQPTAPEAGRPTTFAPAAPAAVVSPPTPPIVPPEQPAVLPPPQVEVVTPAPPAIAPATQTAATASLPPGVETPAPTAAAPLQLAAAAPPPVSVAPQAAQPLPAAGAAVPAAPRSPTPEALIVLTEEDLAGRAYERLGEVTAEARQNSLFPKKSARVLMDQQLRARAAGLGADAVILIRYDSYSPLLSKKGASATGIAVKYR
jgi:uncharacterized protein YbjQ (UPF0145 family)